MRRWRRRRRDHSRTRDGGGGRGRSGRVWASGRGALPSSPWDRTGPRPCLSMKIESGKFLQFVLTLTQPPTPPYAETIRRRLEPIRGAKRPDAAPNRSEPLEPTRRRPKRRGRLESARARAEAIRSLIDSTPHESTRPGRDDSGPHEPMRCNRNPKAVHPRMHKL